MDANSMTHILSDKAPSIYHAMREAAPPAQRYKRDDLVRMPSGRFAEIRSRGAEDAFAWSDRLGGRDAYRVRFLDDNSIAQFRAAWLDAHCELVGDLS